MWIRTQSRKQLVNASELHIFERYGKFEVYAGSVVLGCYYTEEKAIKVMDMIEDAVLDGLIIENEISNVGNNIRYCHWEKIIFQMPKDGEV